MALSLTRMVAVGAACMLIWAQIGLSHVGLGQADPGKCLQAFYNTPECVSAVTEALFQFQRSSNLTQACCNAVTTLSDDCWSFVFLGFPSIPYLKFLKGICDFQKGNAKP
ncbi:hypothetical protein HN51_002372 [Arachis hypogaea]|uniref:Uncharacterized protein LOC107461536 n=1 Tax=Arachis duranensis TaxID=130453 RepID=A0A6P4BCG1_ARADU|nr:uncharacterized protein LOC107461536 [Arachis duranensis]XP_025658072.1 uncharacterized protein LOC112754574 [Arachis hypogaea]